MRDYQAYLRSDTADWSRGMQLLTAMSRNVGISFGLHHYEEGLRRLAQIRPSMLGHEAQWFASDFVLPLGRIREIVAEATRDVGMTLTEPALRGSPEAAKTVRYDVPRIADVEGLRAQIEFLLGTKAHTFRNFDSRRLFAFGSCFAINMGRALRDAGNSVYTLVISEDVNSPFNNRLLLRRIFNGEASSLTDELERLTGINYAKVRSEFQGATDIVFTLGNIFRIMGPHGVTTDHRKAIALMAENFGQSLECVREIFDMLAENTKARIFATVSPIPISGYRGKDFGSAVEADCASKSQLRAVLNNCKHERVTYLPTFEIFRWLPAHQDFATLGAEDGNPRHLTQAHVSMVMEALT